MPIRAPSTPLTRKKDVTDHLLEAMGSSDRATYRGKDGSTYLVSRFPPGTNFSPIKDFDGTSPQKVTTSLSQSIKSSVTEKPEASLWQTAGRLAVIASAFFFVGYVTSKTLERHCFVNPNDISVAYCAELAHGSDPNSGIYEQFKHVDQWVRSDNFTKHTYEQVQGLVGSGLTFVHETVRKYFGSIFS